MSALPYWALGIWTLVLMLSMVIIYMLLRYDDFDDRDF